MTFYRDESTRDYVLRRIKEEMGVDLSGTSYEFEEEFYHENREKVRIIELETCTKLLRMSEEDALRLVSLLEEQREILHEEKKNNRGEFIMEEKCLI